MKNLPNIISLIRIVLSISLFFFHYQDFIFIFIYILCGLTDVLDGYIARKYNAQSTLGSKIDAFADIFLFIIITFIIVTQVGDSLKPFIPLVLVVIFIRIINVIISSVKYKTFVIIHTWANKVTGLLVFTVPLLLSNVIFILPICIIAILSATEELFIHLFIPKLDMNRKSLFFN